MFDVGSRKIAALLLCLPAVAGAAGEPLPPAPLPAGATRVMEEVLVVGSQPGPGLWRVEDPASGHELWIVGTHSPLPKKMQWRADEALARVAGSGTVIAPPGATVDPGVGRFRALLLLPALMKSRRNPDGAKLADVVPPALHARWSAQKREYLPRNRKVETWRPLFAARELYEQALDEHGLSERNVAWREVEKAAEKAGIEIVRPLVTVELEGARDMIRDFSGRTLDDVPCFEATLARVERDLPTLRALANAWAVGDIEALRARPQPDPGPLCQRALLGAAPQDRDAFADLPGRVRAQWLDAAIAALGRHRQCVAVLPVGMLLAEDGVLAALAERGLRVEAPE